VAEKSNATTTTCQFLVTLTARSPHSLMKI
jgi:hypothetical protein